MSQEQAFLDGEADAWVKRNPGVTAEAPTDDPVLAALAACGLGVHGALLDAGGAAGRVAAGFLRDHPGWTARVVDPSAEAMRVGRAAFPRVQFEQGTITRPLPAATAARAQYDVIVVSGVFCWVERALLSQAIAATDAALADGGLLVIVDFDAPFPRANAYRHRAGLYTYKQDYAACYLGLGIYHLVRRVSFVADSVANPADPYDRQYMSAVLRKDLTGRYARSE